MLTRHVEHALESSGQKTPQKTAQLIVDDEPLYANLTGTEMTKFPLQNRSADEIDIFKTVLWLRSQRRLLVQQEVKHFSTFVEVMMGFPVHLSSSRLDFVFFIDAVQN